MAKVRPTRSATADKLVGKNVLVYINYGEGATEASPVWCLIGGQRGACVTLCRSRSIRYPLYLTDNHSSV